MNRREALSKLGLTVGGSLVIGSQDLLFAEEPSEKKNSNPANKEWTVMIYMSCDNNLSVDMSYALKDIREAAKATNNKVNLMVFYDGNALNAPTLYCDFTDFNAPLYLPASNVEKKYKNENESPNKGDENAASMDSLLNFVDWCMNPAKQNKKTKNNALIVSGHGFGFQSISFLKDNNADFDMTIKSFSSSLDKIRDEIIGQPLDIIGFDCCVMGMLEVAYEIRNSASIMIASEGSIPNAGWTYGSLLGNLVSTESPKETKETAKRFVETFIETQKEFAIGGVSVDMSAWDLSKVENVVKATNKLGEILLFGLNNQSDITQTIKGSLIQAHWESQSYMYEQNVDLKDFCQQLLSATKNLQSSVKVNYSENGKNANGNLLIELRKSCESVISAVDDCILQSGFSGGTYQYSNGISIFFPWTLQTYLFSEKDYKGLNFAESKGKYWNEFLLFFLNEATLRGQNKVSGYKNEILSNPLKINDNSSLKIPENGTHKIPENGTAKIPENGTAKIPENGTAKIPEEGTFKIPEEGTFKGYDSSAYKIVEGAASKMLETSYLTRIDFKNVAKPWDITGFSKPVEKA